MEPDCREAMGEGLIRKKVGNRRFETVSDAFIIGLRFLAGNLIYL
jgi:hypothetical protein